MNLFINFLENHLGKMEYSWHSLDEGGLNDFHVGVFDNAPVEGQTTYPTIGISENPFFDAKQTAFFFETVMVAKTEFGDENIPGILMQIQSLKADKLNKLDKLN